MYTRVASKLEDEDQMDDYQREILEKALKFYERFALPQSRDPSVQQEAGLIGIRVTEIRHRLGQGQAAQSAYRQAIAILSRLAIDQPLEPTHRHALAQAEFGLATFFKANEFWPECLAESRKAAAIWEELARERPLLFEYRQKQAESRSLIGDVYRRLGRLDESQEEHQAALGLAEEVLKERPDSGTFQYLLGDLLCKSAHPRFTRQDRAGYEAMVSRAHSLFEMLVRQHPKVKKYQVAMGDCCIWLSQAYMVDGRFSECQDVLERALTIFEGLAAEHPQCIHCSLNLARVFESMGIASLLKGDQRAAIARTGRAIDICRSLAASGSRSPRRSEASVDLAGKPSRDPGAPRAPCRSRRRLRRGPRPLSRGAAG